MLLIGSDDGLYRMTDFDGSEPNVTRVYETGRVRRIRTFEGLAGVFAATETGLYHSHDGAGWTRLDVPREKVYAVGASPAGDRLYAGTRPAHLYVARTDGGVGAGKDLTWEELDGFQDLPSRDEWRLPRHENLAQVRDVHVHPETPDRVVAGVEVGGVHVSEDGGETWSERRDGVDGDIHELHLLGPDEFVAATGFGLYRTTDAGHSWTRLDAEYEQRYFRTVFSVDGVVYAGGALANSSTWNEPEADPELFVTQNGESIEPVDHLRPDETVTGLTAIDGSVAAATHRGTVMVHETDGWTVAGNFPVPDEVTGRYNPLLWVES